jgi:hypothetical protein
MDELDRSFPGFPLPFEGPGADLISWNVALCHARKLLDDGILTGIDARHLANHLARAWLLYLLGGDIPGLQRAQLVGFVPPRLQFPRLKLYAEIKALRLASIRSAKIAMKGLRRRSMRPALYGEQLFIQVMRVIWERHSASAHRGWTAIGNAKVGRDDSRRGRDGLLRVGQDGPFQRFVDTWLVQIDPDRRPMSRHLFAATRRRMQRRPT